MTQKTVTIHFSNIHFNIILQTVPRQLVFSLLLGFPQPKMLYSHDASTMHDTYADYSTGVPVSCLSVLGGWGQMMKLLTQ
jgi:hypothetical protein